MADVDPLGIVNSELKLNKEADGQKRRANEQVVRQYMKFGNDPWRALYSVTNAVDRRRRKGIIRRGRICSSKDKFSKALKAPFGTKKYLSYKSNQN